MKEETASAFCRIKEYVLGGKWMEGVECQGELTELDWWTMRMYSHGERCSENSIEEF